ncbi:twin-arginine translocation signal domain-containing protein [Streptomyces sp. AJS327]|uniref:CehA/McbA family metallohydrolase n=1 Tax=Streptomyces sp. AJS327 TaxID=2545265 RepID=UPI0015E00777|nr:CehA/McbA family metallohydrolase [Streptomyces sp. AJS327]MBA0053297.1 twin-arginine translocation signal domain-containing protein [Streptomyces sp. AJS327]
MERRDVLKLSAAAGAAGALTLHGVSFARAASGSEHSETISGRLPHGAPDFVYLPVEVPSGVREISVSYSYDQPETPAGTPGNALDIGVFDERGTGRGGEGFRGWSGGFRDSFTLSAERATPGYLPGPVGAGTWHVILGPYTVAPQGLAYEVTVTLRHGAPGATPEPSYPPERARGRGRAWYRGDCHLHTVHSDGERTPEETAAAARAAGLDFITSTEHNTTSGHGAWAGLWGPDLLILCGEEVTTRNGHYLALGTEPGTFVDWRYRARDDAYARWVRAIHRSGGLVVPAHPHCPFVGCQWKFGYAGADAVEVWNGPWTADDELAVAAWDNELLVRGSGEWLPALGSSDAHREPQKVGLPQTVVLAEDLTRPALLRAIRAGHSYLSESSSVTLRLTAKSERGAHADIGERLRASASERVTVRLEAEGAPAMSTLRLLTDQGEMRTAPASNGPLEWRTTASLASYVRAELRHPAADDAPAELPGAMAAMTNPIWLGR